jgi:hypothetical protein
MYVIVLDLALYRTARTYKYSTDTKGVLQYSYIP